MVTHPLVALSRYSCRAASSRVRIDNWLARNGERADRRTYIGTANSSPQTLLRHALRIPRAEMDLRVLDQQVDDRRVLIGRSVSPFSSGHLEEMLLTRSRKGVYDFDDALYAAGSSRRSPFSLPETWRRSVQAADVVIAGSAVLARRAARYARDVRVIPSCIDTTSRAVKTDHGSVGPPRAVWLGSPSTERHLRLATTPLLQAHRSTGLVLDVISSGDASLGELDTIAHRHSWAEHTYENVLLAADFGIMPLPDDEFARGKCSYKLLEYGASGLPVIGSGVGANLRTLALMQGIEANTVTEWTDGLIDLARSSSQVRSVHGAAARLAVEANFEYSVWEDAWLRAVGDDD